MSTGGRPGGGDSNHDAPPVRVVRGVALVAIGVVLGVVLFHSVGRAPAGSVASVAATPGTQSTTTTPPTPATTAAARPPAQVKTLVANGTSTSGAGAKAADTLRKAGYNVLAPTNTTTPAASSAILFLPGYASEARTVATALGLPPTTVMPVPTPPPVANSQTANVVVVIGPDLAGQAAASTAPTTSTTAHTPTTAHTGSTVR